MRPHLSAPSDILVTKGGAEIHELRIRRADSAGESVLIEDSGTVVGSVGIRRTAGAPALHGLAVAESWRGMGLGRLLVAAALLILRAEETPYVTVADPGPAAEWFGGLGFTPDGDLLRHEVTGGYDEVETVGQIADLQVDFARTGTRVRWDPSFTALLQFAQHHGVDTDSLCWAGVCGTCAVRIKQGTVSYEVPPQAEPAEGEVLLCVSRPTTPLVLDL
jgi:ferredoxin/N-acetylglutamate synthase-like GNAT family acetyltransferase